MTKQEIDQLIEAGEPLEKQFMITSIWYLIGGKKITEKKFLAAKERFKGKLEFKFVEGGITIHRYTLKK